MGMDQALVNQIFHGITKAKVYDIAKKTSLDLAFMASAALENEIYIKREDLQPIFSFKIRGAYNRIALLSDAEKQRGVICASAGNHGQGVAYSAQRLGLQAWVVMPRTTPDIKVAAVARYGAKIVLHGDHYTESFEHCLGIVEKTKSCMIHPFDDPLVIAGQGTIGEEIVEQLPDVDYVFVPVGGGGLLAGIAAYIKTVNPKITVIGVEPLDSDAMTRSIECGDRVVLDHVGVFADGVAVKQVGRYTFAACQGMVDGFIRVTTDEICAAIQDLYMESRVLMEPAGALSWAGAKSYIAQHQLKHKKIVTINSGANMGFQRLPFVAERSLTGAGREGLFAVHLANQPGALKQFCGEILRDRKITEFNFRTNGTTDAVIFLGVAMQNHHDHQCLTQALAQYSYEYHDLTENDLAKEHIRHMVGGLSPHGLSEQIYSFVFPERPAALGDFLSLVSERWNISLFHYRSHGSDYGRVLIAFEVSEGQRLEFEQYLNFAGYPFKNQSSNLSYNLFLRSRSPEGL